MVEGMSYADCIRDEHPELWQAPKRIRGRYRIPKRNLTLKRIYGLVVKLVETSKGAPAYAWAERIAGMSSHSKRLTPMSKRTVERYLGLVMKLVSRDYCVRYIEGKGYLVSCPSWEAQKAQGGDLFDPPKLERVARSHWLSRKARNWVKNGGGTPAKSCHIEGVADQYSGNASTNGHKARSRGRSRRAGPAPPALQKLARKILKDRPPPYCPRIRGFGHLAHCGAVHLLRRGYHRDDIGRIVGKALRETDTAAADGLPNHVGKYFWGVLKDLAKKARRWKSADLLASRTEFWRGALEAAIVLEAEYPDLFEQDGNPAIKECRKVLQRIASQEAAEAAKKTAGTGSSLPSFTP